MADHKPITILHCAWCGKPFTYTPTDDDEFRPDSPKLVCDKCFTELSEGNDHDAV